MIHAGIYYPKDSLKTQLCIEGARGLYEILPGAGVGFKKVGAYSHLPPRFPYYLSNPPHSGQESGS